MVGIHVPLKREALPFIEFLHERRDVRAMGRVFIEGRLERHDCVVLIGGIGKDRAAASVKALLGRYQCDYLIHFGSAGALSDDLKIGDIVVADNIIEHDCDKSPRVRADAQLMERALHGSSPLARVIRGPIVSGNEDIMSTARRRELHERFGALAVDWESATVAQICAAASVPVLVLRGITDLAHPGTPAEFSVNLDLVSAHLAEVARRVIAP